MVARISATRPAARAFREEIDEIVGRADDLRSTLLAAAQDDERAFERVVDSTALPKSDPARTEAVQRALEAAAQAPLGAIAVALDVQRAAVALLQFSGRHLISDLGCAAEFAGAAVAASAYNVRVNHRSMRDASIVERQSLELSAYERESQALLQDVRDAVARALARES